MIGAKLVSGVIFAIIYIIMTFRPPRRSSATMSAHEDDRQDQHQVNHHFHTFFYNTIFHLGFRILSIMIRSANKIGANSFITGLTKAFDI